MGHEFIHLISKTGDRGSFLLLFHIIVTRFCLIKHTVLKSPSDLLAIYQNISFLPLSSSLCKPSLFPHKLFSFRLLCSSLSAWLGCSTRLTPGSSHHMVPQEPRGLRCCLGYGRCLLQFICQVCMKRKKVLRFFNGENVFACKKD